MGIIAGSRLRASIPSYITQDLLFYIDATNTDSYSGTGSTINDLSVNNRSCVFINGVFTPEETFKFASQGGCFRELDIPISSGGGSIEFFIKLLPFNTFGNAGFFRNSETFFIIRNSTKVPWVRVFGTSTNNYFFNYVYQTGSYFHLVYTFENSKLVLYINGVKNQEIPVSETFPSMNIPDFNYQDGPNENVFSEYKNLLIYDRALNQTEVTTNYNYFQNLYNF
jgi:hypothetical protein